MVSLKKKCSLVVLFVVSFLSLSAEDFPAFASLEAPIANGWVGGRWKDETAGDKPAVRIMAGTAYANAKVTGAVPETGYVILTVKFYVNGDDGFAIGLGAWGSPTLSVLGEGKGWQTAKLAFPSARAARFIKDGLLPLIIQKSGAQGALIGSVEVGKVGPEALLFAYRDFVRKNTVEALRVGRASDSGLTYVDDYGVQEALNASAEDMKIGVIPFVRNYLKEIYPSDVPKMVERVREGAIKMTPGEFEPFQFGIKALKEIAECKTEVISKLPAGLQVEVRWIESVPIRSQGGSSSKKWHFQPARLWPATIFPSCSVKANEAQGFFVIFHAAADLKAQVVPVQIAVKNGAEVIGTFTVNVTVLPFVLPKQPDMIVMICQSAVIEEDEAVMDLAEHGITGLAAFDGFSPGDFVGWDQYFARLKKFGVDRSFFWYLGNPKSGNSVQESVGKEKFLEYLNGIDARVKDGRYPAYFSVTVDEAIRSGKAMAAIKDLAESIKGAKPLGLKIQGGTLSDVSKYDPLQIDYVACNGNYAANRDWCKANNKLLNIYSSTSTRVSPASMRLVFGFQPWRYEAFAVNGWALNWSNGSAFNDLDAGMSDWQTVLPNWCGRPISTPTWESLREAVDDLRYISVLEGLVKAGKAKGDVLAEIKEKGIKGLQHKTEKVVGDTVFGDEVKDADELIAARELIIAEILKAK
jgi:hypothetical protein